MFNALAREINEKLGDDYAVFSEYQIDQAYSEAVWREYKNIGVLYVGYGDLQLLSGNQGLQGQLMLQLLLAVDEGVKTAEVVSAALDRLVAAQNGTMYTDEGTAYKYILNYHLPTSTGKVENGPDAIRFVRYEVMIDVVLSSTLMLGSEFGIQMQNAAGNFVTLDNVISSVLVNNVMTAENTYLEGNTVRSDAVAKRWSLTVSLLYSPENALHRELLAETNADPQKVWIITYDYYDADGNQHTMTKGVILTNCNLVNERGQFSTFGFEALEATAENG